jgi:hypothetical protein
LKGLDNKEESMDKIDKTYATFKNYLIKNY